MTEPRQTGPVQGTPGEPCRDCGAALATDQRYCLNCGRRRGEPRVDFREHLNGDGPPAASALGAKAPEPVAAPAAEPEKRQRDYAPLAAAGGIAVLGVMLLIGVLIGRGTGTATSSAPPPQVVTVGAAAEGAATASDAQAGGGGKQAKAKEVSKGGGKKGANAAGTGGTGDAVVASEDGLQQLQEQSPEEYQDSSAKLPDEIATPGKAPPTDSKAPGGGSGGTTIE